MSAPHTTWTTGPPSRLRLPVPAAAPPRDDAGLAQWHLLTIGEVARACQLSEKAVRRAIDDGELAAFKLRSRLRVKPQDFEAWIAAQLQQRTTRAVSSPGQRLSRRAAAGTFRALAQGDADSGAMR